MLKKTQAAQPEPGWSSEELESDSEIQGVSYLSIHKMHYSRGAFKVLPFSFYVYIILITDTLKSKPVRSVKSGCVGYTDNIEMEREKCLLLHTKINDCTLVKSF